MSSTSYLKIREQLIQFTGIYVRTFPHSYRNYGAAYGAAESELSSNFRFYQDFLIKNSAKIYEIAAKEISQYLNTYKIYTETTVDEYKLVYYLGRAIEQRFTDMGLRMFAGTTLFSMALILHFKLITLGIKKVELYTAITNLIREDRIWSELGPTGCYLVYKCVSTTDPQLNPPPETKGSGVDKNGMR